MHFCHIQGTRTLLGKESLLLGRIGDNKDTHIDDTAMCFIKVIYSCNNLPKKSLLVG